MPTRSTSSRRRRKAWARYSAGADASPRPCASSSRQRRRATTGGLSWSSSRLVSPARDGWLRLDTLTAPWGVRGEIKVRHDADPDYVQRVARVYLGAERRAV